MFSFVKIKILIFLFDFLQSLSFIFETEAKDL